MNMDMLGSIRKRKAYLERKNALKIKTKMI